MLYKLIIKPLAEKEIAESLSWYYQQDKTLSHRLYKEIDHSLDQLKQEPFHQQKRYKHVRILFLDTFPYGIYYTIEDTVIYVHAFLHTKQDSRQIKTRI